MDPALNPKIAGQSAAGPPALDIRCCLCCSKRLAAHPDHECGVPAVGRCRYCVDQKAKCHKIPARANARFNQLWETVLAYRQAAAAEKPKLQRRFVTIQSRYTKFAEAIKLREDRLSGPRQAKNIEEIGFGLWKTLDRIAGSLEQLVNVQRYRERLPPIVNDPDVDEEEEEEEGSR